MLVYKYGHDDISGSRMFSKNLKHPLSPAGKTILLLASGLGLYNIVVRLLALQCHKQKDIGINTAEGRTPAMYAAALGYNDILTALLLHGADLNATDNEGKNYKGLCTCQF